MPPTMYWHWLLGRRIETASFSYFFIGRSKVRRRLEVWPLIPGFSTSNPEQLRKFHSRSCERNRVKGIRNIDERTHFQPFGGLRKQRESEARPSGRSRAAQFHERTAGETSSQHCVKLRDSAWLEFDGGTVLKSLKSSSDETCFKSSLLQRDGGHGYQSSLFIRPEVRFSSGGRALSRQHCVSVTRGR